VHTTKVMTPADFSYTIGNSKAVLSDILPGFNQHDRIGIVVRRPGGGIGASALLMAAVTQYYNFHRPVLGNSPGKLRIYPDYYIFHVGQRHMDHSKLDIWPLHKEVVVEDDPEQILESINDRGITRLIVEDKVPLTASFLRETINSAEQRIISVLAYSPTGRIQQGDISVNSCSAAEEFVFTALQMSGELSEEAREQLVRSRRLLIDNGRIKETYRRIDLSAALSMLSDAADPGPVMQNYISTLPSAYMARIPE
jgi:hypothetical protein